MPEPRKYPNRQFQHDVIEIVDAHAAGGDPLARITFAYICQARGLGRWEAIVLTASAHETITERNQQ